MHEGHCVSPVQWLKAFFLNLHSIPRLKVVAELLFAKVLDCVGIISYRDARPKEKVLSAVCNAIVLVHICHRHRRPDARAIWRQMRDLHKAQCRPCEFSLSAWALPWVFYVLTAWSDSFVHSLEGLHSGPMLGEVAEVPPSRATVVGVLERESITYSQTSIGGLHEMQMTDNGRSCLTRIRLTATYT